MLPKLKDLSPRAFENLVFDLLSMIGMHNLQWRTPGSDGGRDLEGQFWTRDFAGMARAERWYIECKRYRAAVDWPTVRDKLAYAENHSADFLLLVTTSSLSPQCIDEVNRRNLLNLKPAIRSWSGHDIVMKLTLEPKIALKYSLMSDPRAAPKSFSALSLQLAKMTQAAYAAHEFDSQSQRPLEAAAAIAELMTWRMNDLEEFGHFAPQDFQVTQDKYQWLVIDNSSRSYQIDRSGLRAILTSWRLLTRCESIRLISDMDTDQIHLVAEKSKSRVGESGRDLISELCFWTDTDFSIADTTLSLQPRRR